MTRPAREGNCQTCWQRRALVLTERDICNRCYLQERRGEVGQPHERAFPLFVDMPWAESALCSETDPEAFFPEKGGSTREAKAVCGDCLVRAECLGYALDTGQRFGIWGGCSERERRKLLGLVEDDDAEWAA